MKPVYTNCYACGGEGRVEYDVPRPAGHGSGYIDSEWGECEVCLGSGEVEVICPACGEVMTEEDGNYLVCKACREEE